ncbi:transcription elongation factor Elf1 like-domain-containing protein [Gigaspora rosea]|uniref:Transcription elongation factor 1 homolog n=2 Tax=Gigaspora TaxID=4873 RepID=A0A397U751_9GLOM|nr:elf1p [Gigaspora margarita]RIB04908.1 transcription elongation factor Elf1 like-domain-containing protein [Gigaspora rosea]
MGKRKTKRKRVAKKKLVLDTQFDCIFCNHEKSVDVKMQKETQIGNLTCRICGVGFQSMINSLSDPIDVYSDWVDASEHVRPEGHLSHGDYDDDNEHEREEDDEGSYHQSSHRVIGGGRSPDFDDYDDLEE